MLAVSQNIYILVETPNLNSNLSSQDLDAIRIENNKVHILLPYNKICSNTEIKNYRFVKVQKASEKFKVGLANE
jgi:hypothetical protein